MAVSALAIHRTVPPRTSGRGMAMRRSPERTESGGFLKWTSTGATQSSSDIQSSNGSSYNFIMDQNLVGIIMVILLQFPQMDYYFHKKKSKVDHFRPLKHTLKPIYASGDAPS